MKTFFISNKINFKDEGIAKQNMITSVCEHIRSIMLKNDYKEASINDEKIGYIFSVGGDGTMMHTMNNFLKKEAVIIGINAGNVGFLTPYTIDDVFNGEVFKFLTDNNPRIEGRSLIQYEFNGKTVKAVNEYAFVGSDSNLVIDYSIETRVNNHNSRAGHYRANNLLISGPCGSTAYNMNAGGTILEPSIKAMQIFMIAPTAMGIRPMIFPEQVELIIRFKSNARIFTDGIETDSVKIGDAIVVSMLKEEAKILLPESWNFYSALSEKLHWNNGQKV